MKRNDEEELLALAVMTLVDTAHRRISATIDLTRLQVLGLVESTGPIRPAEIAERLLMTKSAVSRHLSALQDDDQIHVEPDPSDARTFFVTISEQGAASTRTASAAGVRRFAQVIADWTDEEVEAARRSVEKLLEAWAKPLGPPGSQQPPSTSEAETPQPRWMRRRIEKGPN